jgi:CelD/BcsL family acetyltransferase involved in cellulose biosynthesis
MTIDVAQWTVEALRGGAALVRLRDDWEDLYGRCSLATPFQSHAWLDSWWRSYGTSGELVLPLVWRSGRLVAAAAFVRRRRGIDVLTFAGAGVSDYGDVLVDDGCGEDAARRLGQQMATLARHGVIDLAEVRPAAALWQVVAAWPGLAWQIPASICLELPAVSLEEILSELPTRAARRRRKEVRRTAEAGVRACTTAPENVARMVHTMLLLHRRQWQGRGMTPEHGRARFAEHLTRSLTAMVPLGQAELLEFRVGDQLMAVNILMVGHGLVGAYLYGVDPALREIADVIVLMLHNDLVETQRLGRPVLSLMRGDEPHKQRWRPRRVRSQRVLLAANGRVGHLYMRAVRVRAELVPFVEQHMPAVHSAAKRVRKWLTSFT